MSIPTPTNNEQDELRSIIATYKQQRYDLDERYRVNRLGWKVDDGSAEQDLSVRHRRIDDNEIAALQLYISQHYVPIGQASDEGLLDALDRIFEKMNEIIADHEGVDLDFYLKQSNYSMRKAKADIGVAVAQHTKEAVRRARIDELDSLPANPNRLAEHYLKRKSELAAPQQSTGGGDE